MSISTNIDGSTVGGANQLLDLLSLVSNPAVYEAKVKSLQNAIAENQKYVEAVAPVSEILDLREKIKADKAAKVTLQKLFPNRDIIQLNIDGIAAGGGGIHCTTQQEPAI